jgi:beta-glucanase (GH16 family)
MRSLFLITLWLALGSGDSTARAADAEAAASTNEWKLVWADEFEVAGTPDPERWTYEEGLVRNREQQFYTRDRRENARVADGRLIIEARKESFTNRADYTSASLITKGRAAWAHARVEVRAKLPRGRGVWPAIWMLGVNEKRAGWPACGEIDIMEYVGFNPDTIHANVHTRKYNHVKRNGKGSTLEVPKPFEDFHVYAVEWDARRMDFFVDGRRYFTYENEGTGPDAWPFDQPHYLILNLALGGTWAGQRGIDDSIFPQRMEIDYVRVYQARSP